MISDDLSFDEAVKPQVVSTLTASLGDTLAVVDFKSIKPDSSKPLLDFSTIAALPPPLGALLIREQADLLPPHAYRSLVYYFVRYLFHALPLNVAATHASLPDQVSSLSFDFARTVHTSEVNSGSGGERFHNTTVVLDDSSEMALWAWVLSLAFGPDYTSTMDIITKLEANSGTCGHRIGEEEVIATCLTCFSDSSSAMCLACFKNSDHVGHKVDFATSKKVYCDCGSFGRTKTIGCSEHDGRASLPPELALSSVVAPQDLEKYVYPVFQTITHTLSAALAPPFMKNYSPASMPGTDMCREVSHLPPNIAGPLPLASPTFVESSKKKKKADKSTNSKASLSEAPQSWQSGDAFAHERIHQQSTVTLSNFANGMGTPGVFTPSLESATTFETNHAVLVQKVESAIPIDSSLEVKLSTSERSSTRSILTSFGEENKEILPSSSDVNSEPRTEAMKVISSTPTERMNHHRALPAHALETVMVSDPEYFNYLAFSHTHELERLTKQTLGRLHHTIFPSSATRGADDARESSQAIAAAILSNITTNLAETNPHLISRVSRERILLPEFLQSGKELAMAHKNVLLSLPEASKQDAAKIEVSLENSVTYSYLYGKEKNLGDDDNSSPSTFPALETLPSLAVPTSEVTEHDACQAAVSEKKPTPVEPFLYSHFFRSQFSRALDENLTKLAVRLELVSGPFPGKVPIHKKGVIPSWLFRPKETYSSMSDAGKIETNLTPAGFSRFLQLTLSAAPSERILKRIAFAITKNQLHSHLTESKSECTVLPDQLVERSNNYLALQATRLTKLARRSCLAEKQTILPRHWEVTRRHRHPQYAAQTARVRAQRTQSLLSIETKEFQDHNDPSHPMYDEETYRLSMASLVPLTTRQLLMPHGIARTGIVLSDLMTIDHKLSSGQYSQRDKYVTKAENKDDVVFVVHERLAVRYTEKAVETTSLLEQRHADCVDNLPGLENIFQLSNKETSLEKKMPLINTGENEDESTTGNHDNSARALVILSVGDTKSPQTPNSRVGAAYPSAEFFERTTTRVRETLVREVAALYLTELEKMSSALTSSSLVSPPSLRFRYDKRDYVSAMIFNFYHPLNIHNGLMERFVKSVREKSCVVAADVNANVDLDREFGAVKSFAEKLFLRYSSAAVGKRCVSPPISYQNVSDLTPTKVLANIMSELGSHVESIEDTKSTIDQKIFTSRETALRHRFKSARDSTATLTAADGEQDGFLRTRPIPFVFLTLYQRVRPPAFNVPEEKLWAQTIRESIFHSFYLYRRGTFRSYSAVHNSTIKPSSRISSSDTESDDDDEETVKANEANSDGNNENDENNENNNEPRLVVPSITESNITDSTILELNADMSNVDVSTIDASPETNVNTNANADANIENTVDANLESNSETNNDVSTEPPPSDKETVAKSEKDKFRFGISPSVHFGLDLFDTLPKVEARNSTEDSTTELFIQDFQEPRVDTVAQRNPLFPAFVLSSYQANLLTMSAANSGYALTLPSDMVGLGSLCSDLTRTGALEVDLVSNQAQPRRQNQPLVSDSFKSGTEHAPERSVEQSTTAIRSNCSSGQSSTISSLLNAKHLEDPYREEDGAFFMPSVIPPGVSLSSDKLESLAMNTLDSSIPPGSRVVLPRRRVVSLMSMLTTLSEESDALRQVIAAGFMNQSMERGISAEYPLQPLSMERFNAVALELEPERERAILVNQLSLISSEDKSKNDDIALLQVEEDATEQVALENAVLAFQSAAQMKQKASLQKTLASAVLCGLKLAAHKMGLSMKHSPEHNAVLAEKVELLTKEFVYVLSRGSKSLDRGSFNDFMVDFYGRSHTTTQILSLMGFVFPNNNEENHSTLTTKSLSSTFLPRITFSTPRMPLPTTTMLDIFFSPYARSLLQWNSLKSSAQAQPSFENSDREDGLRYSSLVGAPYVLTRETDVPDAANFVNRSENFAELSAVHVYGVEADSTATNIASTGLVGTYLDVRPPENLPQHAGEIIERVSLPIDLMFRNCSTFSYLVDSQFGALVSSLIRNSTFLRAYAAGYLRFERHYHAMASTFPPLELHSPQTSLIGSNGTPNEPVRSVYVGNRESQVSNNTIIFSNKRLASILAIDHSHITTRAALFEDLIRHLFSRGQLVPVMRHNLLEKLPEARAPTTTSLNDVADQNKHIITAFTESTFGPLILLHDSHTLATLCATLSRVDGLGAGPMVTYKAYYRNFYVVDDANLANETIGVFITTFVGAFRDLFTVRSVRQAIDWIETFHSPSASTTKLTEAETFNVARRLKLRKIQIGRRVINTVRSVLTEFWRTQIVQKAKFLSTLDTTADDGTSSGESSTDSKRQIRLLELSMKKYLYMLPVPGFFQLIDDDIRDLPQARDLEMDTLSFSFPPVSVSFKAGVTQGPRAHRFAVAMTGKETTKLDAKTSFFSFSDHAADCEQIASPLIPLHRFVIQLISVCIGQWGLALSDLDLPFIWDKTPLDAINSDIDVRAGSSFRQQYQQLVLDFYAKAGGLSTDDTSPSEQIQQHQRRGQHPLATLYRPFSTSEDLVSRMPLLPFWQLSLPFHARSIAMIAHINARLYNRSGDLDCFAYVLNNSNTIMRSLNVDYTAIQLACVAQGVEPTLATFAKAFGIEQILRLSWSRMDWALLSPYFRLTTLSGDPHPASEPFLTPHLALPEYIVQRIADFTYAEEELWSLDKVGNVVSEFSRSLAKLFLYRDLLTCESREEVSRRRCIQILASGACTLRGMREKYLEKGFATSWPEGQSELVEEHIDKLFFELTQPVNQSEIAQILQEAFLQEATPPSTDYLRSLRPELLDEFDYFSLVFTTEEAAHLASQYVLSNLVARHQTSLKEAESQDQSRQTKSSPPGFFDGVVFPPLVRPLELPHSMKSLEEAMFSPILWHMLRRVTATVLHSILPVDALFLAQTVIVDAKKGRDSKSSPSIFPTRKVKKLKAWKFGLGYSSDLTPSLSLMAAKVNSTMQYLTRGDNTISSAPNPASTLDETVSAALLPTSPLPLSYKILPSARTSSFVNALDKDVLCQSIVSRRAAVMSESTVNIDFVELPAPPIFQALFNSTELSDDTCDVLATSLLGSGVLLGAEHLSDSISASSLPRYSPQSGLNDCYEAWNFADESETDFKMNESLNIFESQQTSTSLAISEKLRRITPELVKRTRRNMDERAYSTKQGSEAFTSILTFLHILADTAMRFERSSEVIKKQFVEFMLAPSHTVVRLHDATTRPLFIRPDFPFTRDSFLGMLLLAANAGLNTGECIEERSEICFLTNQLVFDVAPLRPKMKQILIIFCTLAREVCYYHSNITSCPNQLISTLSVFSAIKEEPLRTLPISAPLADSGFVDYPAALARIAHIVAKFVHDDKDILASLGLVVLEQPSSPSTNDVLDDEHLKQQKKENSARKAKLLMQRMAAKRSQFMSGSKTAPDSAAPELTSNEVAGSIEEVKLSECEDTLGIPTESLVDACVSSGASTFDPIEYHTQRATVEQAAILSRGTESGFYYECVVCQKSETPESLSAAWLGLFHGSAPLLATPPEFLVSQLETLVPRSTIRVATASRRPKLPSRLNAHKILFSLHKQRVLLSNVSQKYFEKQENGKDSDSDHDDTAFSHAGLPEVPFAMLTREERNERQEIEKALNESRDSVNSLSDTEEDYLAWISFAEALGNASLTRPTPVEDLVESFGDEEIECIDFKPINYDPARTQSSDQSSSQSNNQSESSDEGYDSSVEFPQDMSLLCEDIHASEEDEDADNSDVGADGDDELDIDIELESDEKPGTSQVISPLQKENQVSKDLANILAGSVRGVGDDESDDGSTIPTCVQTQEGSKVHTETDSSSSSSSDSSSSSSSDSSSRTSSGSSSSSSSSSSASSGSDVDEESASTLKPTPDPFGIKKPMPKQSFCKDRETTLYSRHLRATNFYFMSQHKAFSHAMVFLATTSRTNLDQLTTQPREGALFNPKQRVIAPIQRSLNLNEPMNSINRNDDWERRLQAYSSQPISLEVHTRASLSTSEAYVTEEWRALCDNLPLNTKFLIRPTAEIIKHRAQTLKQSADDDNLYACAHDPDLYGLAPICQVNSTPLSLEQTLPVSRIQSLSCQTRFGPKLSETNFPRLFFNTVGGSDYDDKVVGMNQRSIPYPLHNSFQNLRNIRRQLVLESISPAIQDGDVYNETFLGTGLNSEVTVCKSLTDGDESQTTLRAEPKPVADEQKEEENVLFDLEAKTEIEAEIEVEAEVEVEVEAEAEADQVMVVPVQIVDNSLETEVRHSRDEGISASHAVPEADVVPEADAVSAADVESEFLEVFGLSPEPAVTSETEVVPEENAASETTEESEANDETSSENDDDDDAYPPLSQSDISDFEFSDEAYYLNNPERLPGAKCKDIQLTAEALEEDVTSFRQVSSNLFDFSEDEEGGTAQFSFHESFEKKRSTPASWPRNALLERCSTIKTQTQAQKKDGECKDVLAPVSVSSLVKKAYKIWSLADRIILSDDMKHFISRVFVDNFRRSFSSSPITLPRTLLTAPILASGVPEWVFASIHTGLISAKPAPTIVTEIIPEKTSEMTSEKTSIVVSEPSAVEKEIHISPSLCSVDDSASGSSQQFLHKLSLWSPSQAGAETFITYADYLLHTSYAFNHHQPWTQCNCSECFALVNEEEYVQHYHNMLLRGLQLRVFATGAYSCFDTVVSVGDLISDVFVDAQNERVYANGTEIFSHPANRSPAIIYSYGDESIKYEQCVFDDVLLTMLQYPPTANIYSLLGSSSSDYTDSEDVTPKMALLTAEQGSVETETDSSRDNLAYLYSSEARRYGNSVLPTPEELISSKMPVRGILAMASLMRFHPSARPGLRDNKPLRQTHLRAVSKIFPSALSRSVLRRISRRFTDSRTFGLGHFEEQEDLHADIEKESEFAPASSLISSPRGIQNKRARCQSPQSPALARRFTDMSNLNSSRLLMPLPNSFVVVIGPTCDENSGLDTTITVGAPTPLRANPLMDEFSTTDNVSTPSQNPSLHERFGFEDFGQEALLSVQRYLNSGHFASSHSSHRVGLVSCGHAVHVGCVRALKYITPGPETWLCPYCRIPATTLLPVITEQSLDAARFQDYGENTPLLPASTLAYVHPRVNNTAHLNEVASFLAETGNNKANSLLHQSWAQKKHLRLKREAYLDAIALYSSRLRTISTNLTAHAKSFEPIRVRLPQSFFSTLSPSLSTPLLSRWLWKSLQETHVRVLEQTEAQVGSTLLGGVLHSLAHEAGVLPRHRLSRIAEAFKGLDSRDNALASLQRWLDANILPEIYSPLKEPKSCQEHSLDPNDSENPSLLETYQQMYSLAAKQYQHVIKRSLGTSYDPISEHRIRYLAKQEAVHSMQYVSGWLSSKLVNSVISHSHGLLDIRLDNPDHADDSNFQTAPLTALIHCALSSLCDIEVANRTWGVQMRSSHRVSASSTESADATLSTFVIDSFQSSQPPTPSILTQVYPREIGVLSNLISMAMVFDDGATQSKYPPTLGFKPKKLRSYYDSENSDDSEGSEGSDKNTDEESNDEYYDHIFENRKEDKKLRKQRRRRYAIGIHASPLKNDDFFENIVSNTRVGVEDDQFDRQTPTGSFVLKTLTPLDKQNNSLRENTEVLSAATQIRTERARDIVQARRLREEAVNRFEKHAASAASVFRNSQLRQALLGESYFKLLFSFAQPSLGEIKSDKKDGRFDYAPVQLLAVESTKDYSMLPAIQQQSMSKDQFVSTGDSTGFPSCSDQKLTSTRSVEEKNGVTIAPWNVPVPESTEEASAVYLLLSNLEKQIIEEKRIVNLTQPLNHSGLVSQEEAVLTASIAHSVEEQLGTAVPLARVLEATAPLPLNSDMFEIVFISYLASASEAGISSQRTAAASALLLAPSSSVTLDSEVKQDSDGEETTLEMESILRAKRVETLNRGGVASLSDFTPSPATPQLSAPVASILSSSPLLATSLHYAFVGQIIQAVSSMLYSYFDSQHNGTIMDLLSTTFTALSKEEHVNAMLTEKAAHEDDEHSLDTRLRHFAKTHPHVQPSHEERANLFSALLHVPDSSSHETCFARYSDLDDVLAASLSELHKEFSAYHPFTGAREINWSQHKHQKKSSDMASPEADSRPVTPVSHYLPPTLALALLVLPFLRRCALLFVCQQSSPLQSSHSLLSASPYSLSLGATSARQGIVGEQFTNAMSKNEDKVAALARTTCYFRFTEPAFVIPSCDSASNSIPAPSLTLHEHFARTLKHAISAVHAEVESLCAFLGLPVPSSFLLNRHSTRDQTDPVLVKYTRRWLTAIQSTTRFATAKHLAETHPARVTHAQLYPHLDAKLVKRRTKSSPFSFPVLTSPHARVDALAHLPYSVLGLVRNAQFKNTSWLRYRPSLAYTIPLPRLPAPYIAPSVTMFSPPRLVTPPVSLLEFLTRCQLVYQNCEACGKHLENYHICFCCGAVLTTLHKCLRAPHSTLPISPGDFYRHSEVEAKRWEVGLNAPDLGPITSHMEMCSGSRGLVYDIDSNCAYVVMDSAFMTNPTKLYRDDLGTTGSYRNSIEKSRASLQLSVFDELCSKHVRRNFHIQDAAYAYQGPTLNI